MDNDLISREALKKALEEDMKYGGVKTDEFDKGYDLGIKAAIEMLDNASTVPLPDFKEGYKQAIVDGKTNFSRPQGEWRPKTDFDGFTYCVCSSCNWLNCGVVLNFCPNCGADMRKGGAKNDT